MLTVKPLDWIYYSPKFEYEKEFGDLSSAWEGHRYFIYDLIRNLKPTQIVELGTYKGGSLFSMAQAIKDGKMKCQLVGVDTWEGDKHTGFYGPDIFKNVKNISKKVYNEVSIKLVKQSFDIGSQRIDNKSVDILHIDGLHTYKAVKHDFDRWVSKVKTNGIVLFHDTQETKGDFEVYRLWNELKKKHPYFDFFHSHGLGLIFLSNDYDEILCFRDIWAKYYDLVDKYRILSKKSNKKIQELNIRLEENSQLKSEIINLVNEIFPLRLEVEELVNSRFFKSWQAYNNFKKSIATRS